MEKMPRWDKLRLLNNSEIEIYYNGNVYKGRVDGVGTFINIFSKNGSEEWHPSLCKELFDDWKYRHPNAFESFKNSASSGAWPETPDPIGFAIEYMKTYGSGIIYDERTQGIPISIGSGILAQIDHAEKCSIKIDEIKKKIDEIDEIKKKEDNSLNTNIFKQQVKPNYKFTL